MAANRSSSKDVEKVTIPYLHHKVDVNNLKFDPDLPNDFSKAKINPVETLKVPADIKGMQQEYAIAAVLGNGAFGTIKLAQNKSTGEWLAIKDIDTTDLNRVELNALEQEKENLKKSNQLFFDMTVNNKRFIGIKMAPGHQLYGTLYSESMQSISRLQQLAIIKNMLKKFVDLYQSKQDITKPRSERFRLLHRDIKSDNIILNPSNCTVEHVDYGFSVKLKTDYSLFISDFPPNETSIGYFRLDEGNDPNKQGAYVYSRKQEAIYYLDYEKKEVIKVKGGIKEDQLKSGLGLGEEKHISKLSDHQLKSLQKLTEYKPSESIKDKMVGTPMYMAPEVIKDKIYSEKSEVFAMGMVVAEVLGLARDENIYKDPNLSGLNRYLLKKTEDVDQETFDYIKRMVDEDPAKRPSAVEAYIFFNSLFSEEAKNGKGLKVATISIDMFLNLSKSDQAKLIKNIKAEKINAVALIDTRMDSTTQQHLQVKNILERSGIISISPFVFKGENQEKVMSAVKNYYDGNFASIKTEIYSTTKTKLKKQNVKSEALSFSKISLNQQEQLVLKDMLKVISGKLEFANDFFKNKRDKTVIENLQNILKDGNYSDQEKLIKLTRELEQTYLVSLKQAKSFLSRENITSTKINQHKEKYDMPRALGVLLASAYKVMDNIEPFKDVEKKYKDVLNIDSNVISGSKKFKNLEFAQDLPVMLSKTQKTAIH